MQWNSKAPPSLAHAVANSLGTVEQAGKMPQCKKSPSLAFTISFDPRPCLIEGRLGAREICR
jgi:hypothetical protein